MNGAFVEMGRSLNPLWQETVAQAISVRELTCEPCDVVLARRLNEEWHSRLPKTQVSPWQYAFASHKEGLVYAVALWHNPSARTLPFHWLELRRLAIAPDAPHCTASWMLARMARWFSRFTPERERLISYQDLSVHKGTIYRAAGWKKAYTSKPRQRDRSKSRVGSLGRRDYRSSINGLDPDVAGKIRWEKLL